MTLLTQPNRWSCIPTAVAMLLNLDLKVVLESVGHDGSLVKWKSRSKDRVGFQIEEFSTLALQYGYALVSFPVGIIYCPTGEDDEHKVDLSYYMKAAMCQYDGIILGSYPNSKAKHAVAWNASEVKIYDPAGSIKNPTDLVTSDFRAAVPTRQ